MGNKREIFDPLSTGDRRTPSIRELGTAGNDGWYTRNTVRTRDLHVRSVT